jgi:hypothetical protein
MKLTNVSLAAAALLVLPAVVHAQSGRRQRDARPERDAAPTRRQGQTAQPSAAQSRQNPSTSPARAARMEDQYKLLLERSIFARSGAARAVERTTTTSTAPAVKPLSPEQTIVFIGVLAQDHEYVAFAENRSNNQLMILRTGDDVAKGKVVGITLDTMAYGVAGAIKEVHLGQNLAGEVVAPGYAAGGATATAAPGAATATPGAAVPPGKESVAEQMRQRRLRGE